MKRNGRNQFKECIASPRLCFRVQKFNKAENKYVYYHSSLENSLFWPGFFWGRVEILFFWNKPKIVRVDRQLDIKNRLHDAELTNFRVIL